MYLFVGEGSDTAGLVLEAGLPPLQNVAHVPQIPHQHPPPSCSYDQSVPGHRQRVHLDTETMAEPRRESPWRIARTVIQALLEMINVAPNTFFI